MRWKKTSNLIIVIVLSIAYTIVTLLNIIGPLHTNAEGLINVPTALIFYTLLYYSLALIVTWFLYFSLRKRPELTFFTLFIVGIVLIVMEIYLWAILGSFY